MHATTRMAAGAGPIAAAALAALLIGPTPANAGNPNYGVSTIAGISQYGGASDDNGRAYNPQYFYNVVGGQYPPGYPSGPYAPGDTGVYSHSGNSLSGLTSTGTTDTTGNLTSAYDGISGTDSNGGPASAYAGADLASASLHATAAGTFEGVYQGEDYYSVGGAQADFYDTLTFHVAGASASTVTDITMTFNIDGSATSTRLATYGGQFMGMNYTLALGGTDFNQNGRWAPTTGGTGVQGPVPVYTGPISANDGGGNLTLVSIDQIADTPDDTRLRVTYQLTGSSITAGIFDGLSLGCLDGVSCDWLNTSAIAFQLPTGVTLTSASGVFLTASAGVPEAASWALMLVGFGLMGAALRARLISTRSS
jgi:hypothetical protein